MVRSKGAKPSEDITLSRFRADEVIRKKPATYADLEALPPEMVGELIDGELIASPRPAIVHAYASSKLTIIIGGRFDGPGAGWWILDEPELHFPVRRGQRRIVEKRERKAVKRGFHALVPDIAGWRLSTLPQLPRVQALEVPPDWVCEVVSPGTAQIDRGPKRRIYGENRVGHLWILDPVARSLETYALEGERLLPVEVYGGKQRVKAPPFEALELYLALLWLD